MKRTITTALAATLMMLAFSACAAPVSEDAGRGTTGTSPVTAKQTTAVITVEAPSDQPPL